MLAQLFPATNDFAALARYFIDGKSKPTPPNRVAWVFGHNIPTEDPILAATFMAATAELSMRCKDACLHTVIAWHEDERPTPEAMQEIARRTLDLAGLGEHQALVMGHGDRPHPHLHIMLNRVHPETGKAYDLFQSHRRFDRIMKQLAEEHGFRYVPPHAFEPEATAELSKAPNSAATHAAKRGAPTDRTQWPRNVAHEYGAAISQTVDRATGWDDLALAFAEDGLTLEAKGQGLVVGDAASYTKFSALGLQSSAQSFEKRFGPRRPRMHRSGWFAERLAGERSSMAGIWLSARDWAGMRKRGGIEPRAGRHAIGDRTSTTSLSSHDDQAVRRGRRTQTIVKRPAPSAQKPRASGKTSQRHGTSWLPKSKRTRSKHPGRNPWAVDAIDIVRAIGTKAQLRETVNALRARRIARRANLPLIDQLMAELMDSWKAGTALGRGGKGKAGRAQGKKTGKLTAARKNSR